MLTLKDLKISTDAADEPPPEGVSRAGVGVRLEEFILGFALSRELYDE